MSNKPVTDPALHDGSAPNCCNFNTVVGALGRKANLHRTCPNLDCANAPRRGRRKAVRP